VYSCKLLRQTQSEKRGQEEVRMKLNSFQQGASSICMMRDLRLPKNATALPCPFRKLLPSGQMYKAIWKEPSSSVSAFQQAKRRMAHLTVLSIMKPCSLFSSSRFKCSHPSLPAHNAYVLRSFSCTGGVSCWRNPLKSGIICRNPDMICKRVSKTGHLQVDGDCLPARNSP
jgi:hypothetical protein